MKTETLHTRVSTSKREEIEKQAASQGYSVSEYMRNAALHNFSNLAQQTNEQIIFAKLCELTELISQIHDCSLRRKFNDWRHRTWQSIK